MIPWYVIQIRTGHERDMLTACRRLADEEEAREVFQFVTAREYRNREGWITKYERVFPGYLFVATEHPEDLFFKLKKIPDLTKILRKDTDFYKVDPENRAFLEAIGGEDHVISISRGIREGEQVRILDGPLKACSGRIKCLRRHNREAIVEIHMLGEVHEIRFPVNILRGGSVLRQ